MIPLVKKLVFSFLQVASTAFQSTIERIEQLLADLGEPLDGPEAAD